MLYSNNPSKIFSTVSWVIIHKYILTLCLYLLRADLALLISIFSSVSNLKDTTYACGTHILTRGANNFGTSCNCIFGTTVD